MRQRGRSDKFLRRNLIRDIANESIFRVSGDTNFENFTAWHQTWGGTFLGSMCLPVCSKKLWIYTSLQSGNCVNIKCLPNFGNYV